ncbi:MAG: GNAT family N-acetyltransferase [Natronospirillum sp.]
MHYLTPRDDRQSVTTRSVQWRVDAFDALSVHSLYQIMKARIDVFVVEQACPYPELDDQDQTALHVQAYGSEGLAAYARIIPPDPEGRVFIGRILTSRLYRGQGMGTALMTEARRRALTSFPGAELWLSAQAHLESFYGRFGFVVAGEGYLEDGIPHLPMSRSVDSDESSEPVQAAD